RHRDGREVETGEVRDHPIDAGEPRNGHAIARLREPTMVKPAREGLDSIPHLGVTPRVEARESPHGAVFHHLERALAEGRTTGIQRARERQRFDAAALARSDFLQRFGHRGGALEIEIVWEAALMAVEGSL